VEGKTCREAFEELIAREFQYPVCGQVHHLTVLCYDLQHPRQFTPQALAWSQDALRAAVEEGVSPVELRRRARQQFSRKNKPRVIKESSPASFAEAGEKDKPAFRWRMTALDALGESAEGHNQRVEAWARSVLADLDPSQ
jgi:hypothetical protein